MKAAKKLKSIFVLILLVAILGILAFIVGSMVWAVLEGRVAASAEQEKKAPAAAPPRVSVQGGETVITLNKEMQERSGIAVAPLKPVSHQQEIHAYGSILSLQGLFNLWKSLIDSRQRLVNLQNGHAAARAQVEKTRANLDASSKQYERLKKLYKEDQNISAKSYQAAEATWMSDQAELRASQVALGASRDSIQAEQEVLSALEEGARQEWGPVLTAWLWGNNPSFQRLIRQQDVLIQITLPAGVQIPSAPDSIQIRSPSGKPTPAQLVSPAPRTDPRIQGMSFFYTASSQPTLLPGMNVWAALPSGSPVEGFIIPASAVVWWEGKPWVYVQRDSDQFVRRGISERIPAEKGFFAREGFSTGERVVVKGAQLLLSEEVSGPKGTEKGGRAEE